MLASTFILRTNYARPYCWVMSIAEYAKQKLKDEQCSLLRAGGEHSRICKAKIKGRGVLAHTVVY